MELFNQSLINCSSMLMFQGHYDAEKFYSVGDVIIGATDILLILTNNYTWQILDNNTVPIDEYVFIKCKCGCTYFSNKHCICCGALKGEI